MKLIHLMLLLVLMPLAAMAESFDGRVVSIADGDTLTVLTAANEQVRVRLAQIDAPESKQDFGTRSKQSLSEMVFGKTVTVDVETTDRYGRKVGTIWYDAIDINLEQVRRGMAWVYVQYARDRAYFQAETDARSAGRGLWAHPNPIPPWEYRRR
jgi:endonuclease YncB( thermonuclease family)